MGRAVGGPWRARAWPRGGRDRGRDAGAPASCRPRRPAAVGHEGRCARTRRPKLAQVGPRHLLGVPRQDHASCWSPSTPSPCTPAPRSRSPSRCATGPRRPATTPRPTPRVAPGPTATTLQAGPCGSVGFEIFGPHHTNVWPGVAGRQLPGARLRAAAGQGHGVGLGHLEPDEAQQHGTGSRPGNYTLVVDNSPLQLPAPRPGALRQGWGATPPGPAPSPAPARAARGPARPALDIGPVRSIVT